MKTKLLLIFVLFFSCVSIAQWTRVSNNMHYGINRIYAMDAKENFCAAIVNYQYFQDGKFHYESGLFKTFDNGINWQKITFDSLLLTKLYNPMDFCVVDSLIYFVATDKGAIVATDDGGKTWVVQFSDSSLTTFMNYIEMFDDQNGIAMGDCPDYGTPSDTNKALFLKTIDGGKNWVVQENNQTLFLSGDTWRRIDFISPEIGFFAQDLGNPINTINGLLKTIDSGDNWSLINSNGSIMVMKFYDENFGFSVANNSSFQKTIWKTVNGGMEWKEVNNSLSGWGNDIEFIKNDPSKIWVTDSYNLFYSSDSGETWTKQVVVSSGLTARDIDFVNDHQGWVQCDKYIYYTENLGGFIVDVEENTPQNIPSTFSLSQNYPNPFNPSTNIRFVIPNEVKNLNDTRSKEYYSVLQNVTLKVYDVLGREVATLVNEQKPAGSYEVMFDASGLSSGIYFYRISINSDKLQTGSFVQTRKMILMK